MQSWIFFCHSCQNIIYLLCPFRKKSLPLALQLIWAISLSSTSHSCHAIFFSFHAEKLKHRAWLHGYLLQGRTTTHDMGMGPGVAKVLEGNWRFTNATGPGSWSIPIPCVATGTVARAGAAGQHLALPRHLSQSNNFGHFIRHWEKQILLSLCNIKKPTDRSPMRQIDSLRWSPHSGAVFSSGLLVLYWILVLHEKSFLEIK